LSQKLENKAEQILEGAFKEFLHHGYERTTMDKVAQSAKVSKQTLYNHFCDKDGLFTALVKQMACEKFRLVWSKPLSGKPGQVLRELAYRLLEETKDRYYLCFLRLIVAESEKRPDLAQLFLENIAQPSIKILTQYIQQHPELQHADPEAIARIFVGALIHYNLTQEMLQGGKILPLSQERLVDSLIQLIVNEENK
jgi:AcrR family transcriptional regulator